MRKFISRGIAMIAVTAAVLLGLSGAGTAATDAQVRAPEVFGFYNKGNPTKCMDLSSFGAGTPVTLYDCNFNATSQWFYTPGENMIRSYETGYCMDVRSFTVGAVVHMQPCHGGTSQKWWFRDYTIYSYGNNSLCMDVRSYNNGTPLTLFGCHGGGSQQWVAW